MSDKIIVFVKLDSKNDRNQELYEFAKKLIQPINSESGCLHYELGCNDDGTVFKVITFTDENSHKIHMDSDHVQNFLSEIKDLDVEIEIEKIRPYT